MKNKALTLGLWLLTAVTLSACQQATDPESPENSNSGNEHATSSLTETYWKLSTLEGNPVVMTGEQEREQHFVLNTQNQQLNGFSGCNRFFGPFEATQNDKQGTLVFSGLGATKMACPDLDIDEQSFLSVFGNTAAYQITGETLTLLDKSTQELATFEAVALP